jgi:ubiquinone/menaquinone biosynthesis C-methylase UbiE
LPLPDGRARYVFVEHFLEHLDYSTEVPRFLTECFRVLQEDGTMRVIVPDVERFTRAYCGRGLDWFKYVEPQRSFRTAGQGLAFSFYQDGRHRSAWGCETLAMKLRSVGFTQVYRTEYRNGPIAALNLEGESPARAAHSLCVNAIK